MRLPYPVLCKRCHKNMTSYIDEICDDCFSFEQCKEDILCPSCKVKLKKGVLYMANKRFAFYVCQSCGYVILNKSTIEKITSISEIKKIIDLP